MQYYYYVNKSAGSLDSNAAKKLLEYQKSRGVASRLQSKQLAPPGGSSSGGTKKDITLDGGLLKAAVAREDLANARPTNDKSSVDKKRGYNSSKSGDNEVTQEDLEAYRMKRLKDDDPMSKFQNCDELLDYK